MTLTTPERLLINDFDLKTLATNVSTLAATLRMPPRRGQNLSIAGMHGSIWTPRKKFDQNVLNWPIWLVGANADGSIPVDTNDRILFFQNVDTLLRVLFGAMNELSTIRHFLPDGTVRTNGAEIVDAVDFTTVGASPMALIQVALVLPYPFWEEEDSTFTKTIPLGLNWSSYDGVPVVIDELAGANAPVEDAIIEIWDPPDNATYRSGSDVTAAGDISFWVDGDVFDDNTVIQVDAGRHRVYEGTYGITSLVTNRHPNPSGGANTTGHAVVSGIGGAVTRFTSGVKPVGGPAFLQSSSSGSGTFDIRTHVFDAPTTTSMGYTVGQQYTWSMWVRLRAGSTSASLQFRVRVGFYDNGGLLSSQDGSLVTATRSTSDSNDFLSWTRISLVATVPANTTRVDFKLISTAAVNGDIANWLGCMVTSGATLHPFFDGDYPACDWTGSQFNSSSILRGETSQNLHTNPSFETDVSGVTNNGGVGGAPTQATGGVMPVTNPAGNSGTDYGKIIAGSSGSVVAYLLSFTDVAFWLSYFQGKTYTWSCYFRYMGGGASRTVTLTAEFHRTNTSLSSVSGTPVVLTKATSTTQEGRWYRASVTGTVPADCSKIAFYFTVPSCINTDEIHFDSVHIDEGSALLDYRDGRFAGHSWDGTADLSSSYEVMYTYPPFFSELADYSSIAFEGDARFFAFAPNQVGDYEFLIIGNPTGGTTMTKVVITAQRKFLTG